VDHAADLGERLFCMDRRRADAGPKRVERPPRPELSRGERGGTKPLTRWLVAVLCVAGGPCRTELALRPFESQLDCTRYAGAIARALPDGEWGGFTCTTQRPDLPPVRWQARKANR
jgi:hypothetical protein